MHPAYWFLASAIVAAIVVMIATPWIVEGYLRYDRWVERKMGRR